MINEPIPPSASLPASSTACRSTTCQLAGMHVTPCPHAADSVKASTTADLRATVTALADKFSAWGRSETNTNADLTSAWSFVAEELKKALKSASTTATCPKCGSPDRDLHPLTGRNDDEVQMCGNGWHRSETPSASTTAEPVRPVGCPARFYDGLTPEQGLQVTRAFFAGMNAADITTIERQIEALKIESSLEKDHDGDHRLGRRN